MSTNTLPNTKRRRTSIHNNYNNYNKSKRTQKLSSILRNILKDVSTKECKKELLRIIEKKEREDRDQNQLNEKEELDEEEHGEYIKKFESLTEYEKRKADELIITKGLQDMEALLIKYGPRYFRRHGLSIFRQTLEQPSITPKKRSPPRNSPRRNSPHTTSPHTTSPHVTYHDPGKQKRMEMGIYNRNFLNIQEGKSHTSIENKENINPLSPGVNPLRFTKALPGPGPGPKTPLTPLTPLTELINDNQENFEGEHKVMTKSEHQRQLQKIFNGPDN